MDFFGKKFQKRGKRGKTPEKPTTTKKAGDIMPPTLKALLNKPELTSRDAGLVMMYYAKATLEDKEDTLPISIEDLNAIISSVKYRSDRHRFDVLEAFYYAIKDQRERAYDNARRLAGGLNLLNLHIRIFDDHSRQDTLRFNLPLTLTNHGYKYYAAATRAEARQRNYTFYEILSCYLYFYLRLYSKGEALMLPHSVLNGFAQAESQPITQKPIKEQYSRTHFNTYLYDANHPEGLNLDAQAAGDYLLKNVKAHQLTKYEYDKLEEKIDEIDRLYYLDDLDGMQEAIAGLLEYGLVTEEEIEKAKEGDLKEWYATITKELENSERIPSHLTFKNKPKEIPADTTIFTLLEEALKKYDKSESYPTGLIFANDTRPHTKQIRELKLNAPALFDALCEQIQHDIPQFAELDSSELIKATIKGQALEELHNDVMRDKFENVSFAEIKEFIINSKNTSYLEKRQAENGIALYSLMEKDNEPYLSRLNHKGKTYNPPMTEIHPTLQEFKEIDLTKTYKKEIFTPLKMVFAYNTFIDICTEALNIPFMNRCAKLLEIPLMLMIVKNCNDNLYTAYRSIDGSPADKQLRRELCNQLFTQIDPYKTQPSKTFRDAVKENFIEAIKAKHGAEWIKCAAQIIKDLADSSEEETE